MLLFLATLLGAAPTAGGTVSFDAAGVKTVFVNPADKKLHGMVHGGATGDWLHVSGRIHFSCTRNAVKTVRAEVAGGPGPVELNVGNGVLQGGSVEASIPFARLSEVERCPGQTLSKTVTLTMTCAAGPVTARDELKLEVKCEKPSGGTTEVFTRRAPVVLTEGLLDGKLPIVVKAPWISGGPMPLSLGVVVKDGAGKEVFARREAWKGGTEQDHSDWQSVTFPSPPAGHYGLYYEAKWADGSTSLSGKDELVIMSAAERKSLEDTVAASWKDKEAVEARLKAQKIDLCNAKVAVPWLKKQPEVDWVIADDEGGFSYRLKKDLAPTLVHCHEGDTF